jgi:hypothetical protein
METYHSADEYIRALSLRAGLPLGFRVSTATVEFIPREIPAKTPYALNLGFINLESASDSFAAVFTRNSLPGAPVIIGRKRLQEHLTRGVLVNKYPMSAQKAVLRMPSIFCGLWPGKPVERPHIISAPPPA